MFLFSCLNAQVEDHEIDIIKDLAFEEQEIIEALVLYPKDIRESIFKASTSPEVIIKMASIQSRTSKQFKNLVLDYPEEVQKAIWEMTRYPNLINQLVEQPENSKEIIEQYPEQVRDESRMIIQDEFLLLKEVHWLNTLSESTFKNVLDPLPQESKLVFYELIQYPEILDLLSQNIELTILGGDFYKKDPDLVRHHADSLNLYIVRQQAVELEDWKEQLENDPKAMEDLKQVTEEFANEYDFGDVSATAGKDKEIIDDLYYDDEEYDYEYDEQEVQRVEYQYYHYPYWFGYPYWFSYPHWRPYPFWFEWGFYWSPYGSMVIYHMPSPFFMHWYFYRPYHHYQYVHLSNHFINHYYGHRYSRNSISGSVKSWRTSNREVVKEDWMENENKRIPALKEFGKMEDARVVYNYKHPKDVVSKKEYVKKNTKKYPNLNSSVEKPVPQNQVYETQKYKTKLPKTDSRAIPQKPVRKERKIIKYKKAQDYHRQTWQQSRRRTPTKSKATPAPRRTSPKSKTSSKSPRRKN